MTPRYCLLAVLAALYITSCLSASTSLNVCLRAGKDCEACTQIPGCGYCGMYDAEGWCVPGNADGSTLTELGADEECPNALWKFANGSKCYEPQRFIDVDKNSPSVIHLVSLPLPGNSGLENAGDKIDWVFAAGGGGSPPGPPGPPGPGPSGPPPSNSTFRGMNISFAYVFRNGTDCTGNYSMQTVWAEIFEFLDTDGGGFTCDFSDTSCPDRANVIRNYSLHDAYFSLNLTKILVNTTTNFEKYQIVTLQGNLSQGIQVSFQCVVVNTNTSDNNQDYNPYQAPCVFSVRNWPASSNPASRLGIHGYILSETPIAVSSDSSKKSDNSQKYQKESFIGRTEPWEYTLGDKLASLVWGDSAERNATVNNIPANVLASDLFDDDSIAPSFNGFTKSFVISFSGANPQNVSWNPLYHITPFGFPGFVMESSGSALSVQCVVVLLLCILLL
mmetsp:Transcript_5602/g.7838  ORF Transcript_5602/g.7838 Transcript_5602/m.7838 type:complete len:446 (-) Transcript_5602:29-1366(-)